VPNLGGPGVSYADGRPGNQVEIEYVPVAEDLSNPAFAEFAKVFDHFKVTAPEPTPVRRAPTLRFCAIVHPLAHVYAKLQTLPCWAEQADGAVLSEGNVDMAVDGEAGEGAEATVDDSEKEGESDDGAHRISKKRLRKEARLTVAELKQLVRKPDAVEVRTGEAQNALLSLLADVLNWSRFRGPFRWRSRAAVGGRDSGRSAPPCAPQVAAQHRAGAKALGPEAQVPPKQARPGEAALHAAR